MNVIKPHGITLYGGNDKYKIVLRPLSDEYLPYLYKWNSDPEVLYWSEGEDVESYPPETVHRIYGGISQNDLCFAVEVNGEIIGSCWLQKMNLPDVRAMYPVETDVRRIDMLIGEKSFWGKGIGTIFIGMLIDFAFNAEKVDVLHCFSEDYNIRSGRVWKKNGFIRVLTEEIPQPHKGKLQYHWRLTRDGYIGNRSEILHNNGRECGSYPEHKQAIGRVRQYIVDAFTDKVFSGNPAAVCVTERELPEGLMQAVAMENNLSETAFAVREKDMYSLRWFTPGGEIDLCGHATLATAYTIANFYEKDSDIIRFSSKSGVLTVRKNGDFFEMEFPAYKLTETPVTKDITEALGAAPTEAYMGRDLLCVFDDEKTVRELKPDFERLTKLPGALVNVTAPGRDFDCVSRSFAPKYNIAEDPVCGSGHCHIIPYWAGKLGKENLTAYQASRRGGVLHCRMQGDKVILGGKAVLFAVSDILPEGGFTE